MSEPMREVIQGLDVTGIEEAYPKARKVTVDAAKRTAYVFIGRSNRAITVTGAEFDALVKMLPPEVEPAAEDKPQARAKRQKES
jgi:hypothetical protein